MKIANLAQVVNVIAPLVTQGDDLLVQSIYHPFKMVSRRRHGVSLRTVVDGPTYATRTHGVVPVIDASAILDGDTLHVFAVNRSVDEAAPVGIEVARSIGIGAGGRRTSHRIRGEVRKRIQHSTRSRGRGVQ